MENMQRTENCRNCISRNYVTNRGLVCKRTGNIPDLQSECTDFKYDETIDLIAPPPVIEPTAEDLMDYDQLAREENLPVGFVCGLFAAVIGAIIWAAISVSTGFQIGYMAIAMGFLVGYAVRKGGKGVSQIFGFMGALLALLGCLLGDYLSYIGFLAQEYEVTYMDALVIIPVSDMISILYKNLFSMTALFYAFALFQGYKLSFRIQLKNGGKI